MRTSPFITLVAVAWGLLGFNVAHGQYGCLECVDDQADIMASNPHPQNVIYHWYYLRDAYTYELNRWQGIRASAEQGLLLWQAQWDSMFPGGWSPAQVIAMYPDYADLVYDFLYYRIMLEEELMYAVGGVTYWDNALVPVNNTIYNWGT